MSDGAARIEVRLREEERASLDRDALQRYVDGITSDLGLPPAELSVERGDHGSEVSINGVACRVVSSVAWTIHDNREYLVDARFADAMRSDSIGSGSALAVLSRQELLDYFRLMIRGCARVDRSSFLTERACPIQKWSAESCYEEAVRSISDLRCVVTHAPNGAGSPALEDVPIDTVLAGLQYELFVNLGLRVPRIEAREDLLLRAGQWRVQINDLRLPVSEGLPDGEMLVIASPEDAAIDGRVELDPTSLRLVTIATHSSEEQERLRAAGHVVAGRTGYIALACNWILRAHSGCFLVGEAVEHELDQLRTISDMLTLIRERPGLTQMLRSLIEGGISILDLDGVLEAILAVKTTVDVDLSQYIVFSPTGATYAPATFGPRIEDVHPADIAECVRALMKDYVTNRYAKGASMLETYLIDPAIEARIVRSGRWNEKESFTPEEKNQLNDAVKAMIGPLDDHWNRVILTGPEVRRPLKRLIERESPDIAVLSYDELSAHVNISVVETLTFEAK